MNKRYSLDHKALKRVVIKENIYLSFYILTISLTFFFSGIYPLFSNWKFNPEVGLVGKSFYWLLVIAQPIVLFFLIRLLIDYNRFMNYFLSDWVDSTVTINTSGIDITNGSKETITFQFEEIELHNHVFTYSAKNPLFGHGVLLIKTKSKGLNIIIPSYVFDISVGAYVLRDELKNRKNYHQHKLNLKKIKQLINL